MTHENIARQFICLITAAASGDFPTQPQPIANMYRHIGEKLSEPLCPAIAEILSPESDPLFGRDSNKHQLLAEHITAEYWVKTEARGRVVDEWKLRAGGPDNHWFDCLVGCAVAASIQGAVLPGTDVKAAAKREPIRLSDLQRKRY